MTEVSFGDRLSDSRSVSLSPSTWLSRLSHALEFRDRTPPQLISFAGSSDSQRLIATCLHCLFSSSGCVQLTPENQQLVEFALRSFLQQHPSPGSVTIAGGPEIIALQQANAESVHRFNSLRRDLGHEIARLEGELAASRGRVQELTDELQARDRQEEHYKGEIRQLSRTLLDRSSEVRDLRSSLDTRKQQVEDLEGQCRRATLRAHESDSAIIVAPESPNSVIVALASELEKASQELVTLRAAQSTAVRLLAAQGVVIDQLADTATALEIQCKREADDRFRMNEMSSVLSEMKTLTFVEHITDLPEYVRDLMEGERAENQRLRACFEKLLGFTASLINSPIASLDPGIVEREIVRYRQYLDENKLEGGPTTEEAAVDLLRADALMQRIEQLQGEVSSLRRIAELFHFSGDLHNLPVFVRQQLKKAFGGLRKLRVLYQIEDEQELVRQIEADRLMVASFQEELIPALDFDGPSAELPAVAGQHFKALARTIAAQRAEFREQLDEVKRESEVQNARATAYIADLESQVNSSEMRLRELTESLEASDVTVQDIATQESGLRCTLAKVAKNYSVLEALYAALKKENEGLKVELAETNEKGRVRTARLLAEQQRERDEEAEELRVKFAAHVTLFEQALKRKRERNMALKVRIKHITDEYVRAFDAEKEVVRALREQYDQEQSSREAAEAAFKGQIGKLHSQNGQLQAQIAGFTNQLVQVENARDRFWKARIEVLEQARSSPVKSATENLLQLEQRSSELLKEWETWARNTCVSLSRQDLGKTSARELRFLLSEMVLSSVSHRTLLKKLGSLRLQKRLLLRGIPPRPAVGPGLSMHQILTVTIAATRLVRDLQLHPSQ
jgi:hypothetical protein